MVNKRCYMSHFFKLFSFSISFYYFHLVFATLIIKNTSTHVYLTNHVKCLFVLLFFTPCYFAYKSSLLLLLLLLLILLLLLLTLFLSLKTYIIIIIIIIISIFVLILLINIIIFVRYHFLFSLLLK